MQHHPTLRRADCIILCLMTPNLKLTRALREGADLRALKWRRMACTIVLILAATCLSGLGATETRWTPSRLPYSTSAFERAAEFPRGLHVWTRSELEAMIRQRVDYEKGRGELDVDYYRIGHVLSFPLPVAQRPRLQDLPQGIDGIKYPWVIWLSWDLAERWRILHLAWRSLGDTDAGILMQKEMAALATWDHIYEVTDQVSLPTGHLAACLAIALQDPQGWDPLYREAALVAAHAIIDRDVWPWFLKQWGPPQTLSEKQLQNIPAIALLGSAQLARTLGNSHAAELDARAEDVVRTWCRMRVGPEFHCEGQAYDGYLLDSITDWMETRPDRQQFLADLRPALRDATESWMQATLPGRLDLLAPLGDVEAEMNFWPTPLARMAGWYQWHDAQWFLRRFPLQRMRSATLVELFLHPIPESESEMAPTTNPLAMANYAVLRTGWDSDDMALIAGVSRSIMHHLHADTGSLILGWQNRFWITDPGYQQYRKGEERNFTLGNQAHNAPVINGIVQTKPAGQIALMSKPSPHERKVKIELTRCYAALPEGATVTRDIVLQDQPIRTVIVHDVLHGFASETKVSTSWQGGAFLAWSFHERWARLSDGKHVLWIGTHPMQPQPSDLVRHPGSRGPLTLTHTNLLHEGSGEHWYLLVCGRAGDWKPPTIDHRQGEIEIRTAEGSAIYTVNARH